MVKQIKPSDIPEGVITSRGFDLRGQCYNFVYVKYGRLGEVVVMPYQKIKTSFRRTYII